MSRCANWWPRARRATTRAPSESRRDRTQKRPSSPECHGPLVADTGPWPRAQGSVGGPFKLVAGINRDREMLNPHLVVAMRPGVNLSKAQHLFTDRQIRDTLRAAVCGKPICDRNAERSEKLGVERRRSLHILDCEIDVMNRFGRHRTSPFPARSRRRPGSQQTRRWRSRAQPPPRSFCPARGWRTIAVIHPIARQLMSPPARLRSRVACEADERFAAISAARRGRYQRARRRRSRRRSGSVLAISSPLKPGSRSSVAVLA
jgi:hypothetical protein